MWQVMYMKNIKENPIAVQSKQWILKALLDLMSEKDFSTITVKDIQNSFVLMSVQKHIFLFVLNMQIFLCY